MARLPKGLAALDAEGRPVELSELGKERPVLLCFIRHFG